jgi:hypothetical protein
VSQFKIAVSARVSVIVIIVVVGSREMTVTGLQVVGAGVTVLREGVIDRWASLQRETGLKLTRMENGFKEIFDQLRNFKWREMKRKPIPYVYRRNNTGA